MELCNTDCKADDSNSFVARNSNGSSSYSNSVVNSKTENMRYLIDPRGGGGATGGGSGGINDVVGIVTEAIKDIFGKKSSSSPPSDSAAIDFNSLLSGNTAGIPNILIAVVLGFVLLKKALS
jgi:hypothetical protein